MLLIPRVVLAAVARLFSVKTLDSSKPEFEDVLVLPEPSRTPEIELFLLESEFEVFMFPLLFLPDALLAERPDVDLLPSFLATLVPVDLLCP